eukprot:752264-Hanusia_phi.AAC.5
MREVGPNGGGAEGSKLLGDEGHGGDVEVRLGARGRGAGDGERREAGDGERLAERIADSVEMEFLRRVMQDLEIAVHAREELDPPPGVGEITQ